MIIWIYYDYKAYMDYMGLDVHRPRKAIKLNHSLTNCIDAYVLNTLRPRQNGPHFADDIF